MKKNSVSEEKLLRDLLNENARTTNNNITEIAPYHSLEIEELYEKIRALDSLRVQLGTFAGTVNLTIIGFAVSNRNAGLIFIATIILVLFIIIDLTERRTRVQLYQRALQLERKYAPDYFDAIMHRRFKTSNLSKRSFIQKFSIAGFWMPVITIMALQDFPE
jgi:hypothetical protein